MGTPLTLERCAEMRAEMEAGGLREEVLTQAGITSEDWTDAQRGWLDKMGAELQRSRFELTNRYSQAYLERQRALTAATAAVVVEATPPVETAPLPFVALPPIARPPIAPPPVQPSLPGATTPSPWAAPLPRPAAPPPRAPQAAGDETGMPTASPLRQPLPFRPAASSSPDAAARIPPAPPSRPDTPAPRPPSASLGSTTSAGAVSPFAAVLPFSPDAASSPILVNAPTLPKAAPPPLGKPRSLPRATPPPRIVNSPAPAAAPMLDGTVMGAISPFAPTLPFVSAPPAPAPAPIPAPPPSAPGPIAPAPAVAESLTLEQHASLCAEIAFNPAQTDRTLGLYRVSPERKAELDQYWRGRLAAEPALGVKWRESYAIYFGFLSSARPR